jgi:hypothetical protein
MGVKYIEFGNIFILSEPYEDKKTGFTVIPKRVLLDGYIDTIGQILDINKVKMKVLSVKVTEKIIEIELEAVK